MSKKNTGKINEYSYRRKYLYRCRKKIPVKSISKIPIPVSNKNTVTSISKKNTGKIRIEKNIDTGVKKTRDIDIVKNISDKIDIEKTPVMSMSKKIPANINIEKNPGNIDIEKKPR